jgi:hypothetical protein
MTVSKHIPTTTDMYAIKEKLLEVVVPHCFNWGKSLMSWESAFVVGG